jgi:hypothetical protein
MAEVTSSGSRYTVDLVNARKQSFAWKFFGHLHTDGQLTDSDHFFCKICVESKGIITLK